MSLLLLLLATTAQISNELWLLLPYIAKKMMKFVRYKISKVTVEKTLIKEVTDFMYIRKENQISCVHRYDQKC